MPWVKLDDNFPDHPKVALLSSDAGWLHVCALCYCNRQLTDGHVEKGYEHRLTEMSTAATNRAVTMLVDRKLWYDCGDHWLIHGFLDYQPSRDDVLAERAAGAERQRKSRERRAREEAEKRASVTHLSQRDNSVSHGHVTRD